MRHTPNITMPSPAEAKVTGHLAAQMEPSLMILILAVNPCVRSNFTAHREGLRVRTNGSRVEEDITENCRKLEVIMVSLLYLALFLLASFLVLRDKELLVPIRSCNVCLPRYWILAVLGVLFLGAEAFALAGAHNVWVISGVMALSISAFMFALFFVWERHKWILALTQICYVCVITVHFYSWWPQQ